MKHRAPPAGVLSRINRYPARVIWVTVAVLLALGSCGIALGGFPNDEGPTAAPSTSGTAGHIAVDSSPAGPSPTPSRTAKPTRSSPGPTPQRPTRPSTRNGVRPGGPCKVAGAVSRTSTGKALVCKRSAGDKRLRWRSA